MNYPITEQPEKNIVLKTDITQLDNEAFDCVFMMDVLEHVEDDSAFFKSALSKVKKGGILIATVPAFQSLFCSVDVFVKHFRRYGYADFKRLCESENASLLRMHYFYFTLVLPRYIQKKLNLVSLENEKKHGVTGWPFGEKYFITHLIRLVLNADFAVLSALAKLKIRLPGLSLLAVIQKR